MIAAAAMPFSGGRTMTTRGIGLRLWLLTITLLLTAGTGARAGLISLTATLTGAQESPPNTSSGFGAAALILDDVNKILISSVTFQGLSSPTILDSMGASAYINMGFPNQIGPIVHPFLTAPIGVNSGSFTDIWFGLTAPEITALESGGTYINIETTSFPGGEIRGQITSSAIPEPASLVMGAEGALVLLGWAWLCRRRSLA
jgi:hypothetical protein